jgi:rhamnose transport system ATP-binding protein
MLDAQSRPQTVDGRVILSLKGATKIFGGTVAISDVSFDLRAGEVLALLGENGAGKSTCVKLLAGVHRPTLGNVMVAGEIRHFASPQDARHVGIAVMHQHPGLFSDLSIAENLSIGFQEGHSGWFVDARSQIARAKELVELVGLEYDVNAPLSSLRTSEQQLVEIARALSRNARVIIMDEPTAALSQREVDRLFAVVGDLRSRGVAMMFVGHRMDEIYRVADRIAVLRDGRLVATERAADLNRDRAIQLMVGRPLNGLYPKHGEKTGDVVLSVCNLGNGEAFQNVSFDLRAGEILGLGGLVGSGRTEIARVLFGVDQPTSGIIRIDQKPVQFNSAKKAMAHGIAYVSEDRIGQSLVMDFAIRTNASLTALDRVTRGGLILSGKEIEFVKPDLDRLRLRFDSYEQAVSTLSGGNQQKVVLSKWLSIKPRILILDEPTQGIDVQTKADVHAMMSDLASKGMAIILISSELPELLGMCDRMIVLREGRVEAEFVQAEATQEKVIRAATETNSAPKLGKVSLPPSLESATLPQVPLPATIRKRWFAHREFGLVAAITVVVIPVVLINPRMLSPINLTSLAMDLALLTIVAAAQMIVLITRNIDLSVASTIGLSAYGAASTIHAHPQIGVAGAISLSCVIGLCCGLANGLVVSLGRVPAIVVTLGTMSIFRGLDSFWTGGKQISADQVPQEWLDMTSAKILGVPTIVVIALFTLLAMAYGLRSLTIGRELFAIGSNPGGARLIGIPIERRVLLAFAISGLLAGFDGALWASRYATVDARVASGYELTVIASVVVGGVAIRGGSGTLMGVVLGSLVLLIIKNGLTLVRVDPLWLQGVYGLVILLAVGIDAFVARRARLLTKRALP